MDNQLHSMWHWDWIQGQKAQAAGHSASNYSGTSTLRHCLEVHVQLILVALQAHTPTSSYTYKHRKLICIETDTQILSFIYNSPTERDRGTETAGRSLQQTAKTTTLLYQNPSAVFFNTKRPSMSARPLLYKHSDE